MVIKKILLLIGLFILLAFSVNAYCCSNILSGLDFCQKINLSEEEAKEFCCPENLEYGVDINSPNSKLDCEQNYFGIECSDHCDVGCCYNINTLSCVEGVSKVACDGYFSNENGVSCKKEGQFIFDECEQGCCCDINNFYFGNKDSCDGNFYVGVNLQEDCSSKCKSIICVEGCQIQKPLFCKNGNIHYDCTGGDGIVGNDNDCGCPSGKICMPNGRCEDKKSPSFFKTKNSCINEDYNWCELDQRCVFDCLDCSYESTQENNLCVDACLDVRCGENSFCEGGQCVCESGFFISECIFNSLNIDYEGRGCQKNDPCITDNRVIGPWFLVGIFLIFLFMFMLFNIKKKKEKILTHEDEYPVNFPNRQQYYQANYNNSNYNNPYNRNPYDKFR